MIELLDLIEAAEDPLLTWGVVDGGLSEDDLRGLVESWVLDNDPLGDVDYTIDLLVDHGLIHRQHGTGGPVYRSRMAESIRLIARLRQLFPGRADKPGGWQGAATLVSGFRYLRRPRRYPSRDLPSAQVLDAVAPNAGIRRDVAERMIGGYALSGFQQRATIKILADLDVRRARGTIVGAGTGSGKTLAFYLPAMMAIADRMDTTSWTKCLALYPRNELLKDQLQSAVDQAHDLQEILVPERGRPLRIGVLFGDVPQSLHALRAGHYKAWQKQGQTYICPYLRCPALAGERRCHGELLVDATSGTTDPVLTCRDCSGSLGNDRFAIFRQQLRQRPPDLLFCTTEMLNRGLLDPSTAQVIGVDARRGPDLVLLDEVHTYAGASGAMTALTIRRWRARVRSAPAFVGLSATLTDAQRFFADLVGLEEDHVEYIQPLEDELIPEGAEHLLAIRSDPVSGAGVLSTTIQTAMLLGRVMDPIDSPISQGVYGQKVFCFTDDLDVTNRLYFDLLDAEGQRARRWGADLAIKPPLAALRASTHADNPARRAAGQVWDLPAHLGHEIGPTGRLGVERTSSQDAGVDTRKALVVATASLEVGFDDPTVGAVIQHKAPRDVASFLQRRGRAGRERGMRPITAVVLSDYGRDRLAYEQWDRLFDPVLPARHLPIRNLHVLRMQAAMATIEWAISELKLTDGNLWSDLSRPAEGSGRWTDATRERQQAVAQLLRDLLDNEQLQRDLATHLRTSMQLDARLVEEILWHPPRAVLVAAVPALLRRLETDWTSTTATGPGSQLDRGAKQPLPEFIPPNLFSDLALPEIQLRLPVGPPGKVEEFDEPIGLVQGLRETAPGRVSRRFAIRSDKDRHWIPADADGPIDINRFVPTWRREATIAVRDGEGITHLPLLRPLEFLAENPPEDLKDSSNARPRWVSELVPTGPGASLSPVNSDPIGRLLVDVHAFLHRDQSEVESRRASVGSNARLVFDGGGDATFTTTFEADGETVALGGVFDVDALRLRTAVPTPEGVWSGPHAPGLRSAWFQHLVETDHALNEHANPFLLGWIHEVVLTAILREAVGQTRTVEAAWTAVSQDLVSTLGHTLEILLAAPGLVVEEVGVDAGPSRLMNDLRGLLEDPVVLDRLGHLVPQLWLDPGADGATWVARRLARTMGEGLLAGATRFRSEHDPEGVVVDVQPMVDGTPSEAGEVWLTETSIGGGGFIEALAEGIASDPIRFQRLVRTSLGPGPDERVGWALSEVLAEAGPGGEMAASFAAFRGASSSADRTAALSGLRRALGRIGVSPLPETVAAVVNRLLGPGSDVRTDELVRRSLQRWEAAEARLGIEIGVRAWCFLDAARHSELDREELDVLQLVLWPRGWQLRAQPLTGYNPFAVEFPPIPGLLVDILRDYDPGQVDLQADQLDVAWPGISRALADEGVVDVKVPDGDRKTLARLIAHAAVAPVELEYLQLHARLGTIRLLPDGSIMARLELPERL